MYRCHPRKDDYLKYFNHLPDSCGRKPECPEETHTEEPVRHHSMYTSYGILVEPTYVYRYDVSVELFSPWQACLA